MFFTKNHEMYDDISLKKVGDKSKISFQLCQNSSSEFIRIIIYNLMEYRR